MKIKITGSQSWAMQFRMIESQKFVMTNLRNGIDYLKNTCKDVGEDSNLYADRFDHDNYDKL